jgi:hypothetical protein
MRRIAAVCVAALVGLSACSSSSKHSSATTPTVPTPGGGPDAAALRTLLTQGRGRTYHATYRTTVSGHDDLSQTIDVWRKGGRVREDTVVTAGGKVARTATIIDPSTIVTCTKPEPSPWKCMRVPNAAASDPVQLIGLLESQLRGQRVVVTRRTTIAGHAVRCFGVAGGATPELCVTAQGIAALARTAQASLELTSLDTTVADTNFNPPA